MIGIQILATLFVLWMTYFSYLHFRRHEFSLPEFVFWQILWVILFIVVLFPASAKFFLQTFSINRTFDLVVVGGIAILYGITFRSYVLLKRMERKLENLIRERALQDDGERGNHRP